MEVRTRMAPSPTGEFHIGSMRTLLFNYALAKKHSGSFVLRIEDTDRERLVPGSTERLMEAIKLYGLDWDEGPDNGGPYAPYTQSHRLEIYKKYALELVEKKHAYYCFCSKERLDELRASQQQQGNPSSKYDKHCLNLSPEQIQDNLNNNLPFVIRLNVEHGQQVSFNDAVLGKITFPSSDIDDQVLLKSDGFPTYHLAVVIDDYLMKITHVMRGCEWLPSTPKHILLYKAFGWELPVYAHLPLLKEKGQNKKLAKRMGSVGSMDFLAEGYLPEALINFLMFLGWNPGTEKEVYTLDEFVQDFSIEKLHKTDLVVFDREKLLWMNGIYIRSLSLDVLWDKLNGWAAKFNVNLQKSDHTSFDLKVLSLVQERLKKFAEYNDLVKFFYTQIVPQKDDLLVQTGDLSRTKEILQNFSSLLSNISDSDWKTSFLDKISHDFIKEYTYKPKEAFMTLRVAVTGVTSTPPIFDVLELLGKNQVLNRIQNCIKML